MSIDIKLIETSQVLSINKSPFKYDEMGREELLSNYVLSLAAICCPMTKLKLINQLTWSLGALFDDDAIVKMLDQHILHQNLIIRPDRKTRDIYVSQLRYVETAKIMNQKRYILLGVGPADQSLGNEILEKSLKQKNHLRYWEVTDDNEDTLRSLLRDSYIQPFASEEWLKIDDEISNAYHSGSDIFLRDLNNKLDNEPISDSHYEGYEYLDTQTNPRYFKGRWKEISQATKKMRCIIRYQGQYTRIYRYAEIKDRRVVRSISFSSIWGRNLKDEKSIIWMIQQALDYSVQPQVFKCNKLDENYSEIKFFHPIPSWIDRKIISLGEPIPRNEGDHHLFSYRLDSSMLEFIVKELDLFWIMNESTNN